MCPGLLDSTHNSSVTLLLGNISNSAISVKRNQVLGIGRLIPIHHVGSIHLIGGSDEFGLEPSPEEQSSRLDKLLNEFKEIFATSELDYGHMKGVTHQVDTGDHKPFKSRPYRKSRLEETVVQSEIEKLLKSGLLAPSSSPWASPLLLLKKKDGSHRIVMDYR